HVVASLGTRPSASRLRIIDGDAGGGKTVAFNAITEQAYRNFRQAKRELGFGLRPIAFNETHLRATNRDGRSRVDNLIEAVIHIELAQLVPREQFVWLLQHGYTTWLFDGLDEIYGGDPHFFRTIGALMDAPGSCAQILISTRDSLFRTSRYLRDFLAESREIGRNVELLELSPWSEDAWRQMAWIHLEHEREGAQDSARIQGFVDRIRGSRALRSLARLPFYCDELVDMDGAFGSESDVLATIVGRMLEREWNKNVVDWRSYVGRTNREDLVDLYDEAKTQAWFRFLQSQGHNVVVDILQAAAHHRLRSFDDDVTTLPVALLDSLAEAYSGIDPSTEEGSDAALALVQFAFFTAGEEDDSVDFSHPILADFMAARHGVQLVRDSLGDPEEVRVALGPLDRGPVSGVFRRHLVHATHLDRGFRRSLGAALPKTEGPLHDFIEELFAEAR
ncbi:MAG: hypothetical protein AAF602_29955, partial [Myxococcota bacterium]